MAKRKNGELNSLLAEVEVDKIGVARLDDWQGTPLGDKARGLLPGAISVVVLALEVFPEIIDHLTSKAQIGAMALRDLYLCNSEMINGLLNWEAYKIVKGLHDRGFKGLVLPASGEPYDGRFLEGALSYKHLAKDAQPCNLS